MYWILGISIYLLFGCFAWALCVAAGRADERAEHEQRRMNDGTL